MLLETGARRAFKTWSDTNVTLRLSIFSPTPLLTGKHESAKTKDLLGASPIQQLHKFQTDSHLSDMGIKLNPSGPSLPVKHLSLAVEPFGSQILAKFTELLSKTNREHPRAADVQALSGLL